MLKLKARSAVLWSSGDIAIKHGLNFVVTIVLARLLTPVEFGTVALLAIFSGLAGPFIDAGFSSALIQKQDASRTDESTVFWFNLFSGATFAVTLALCAPVIAEFYKLSVLKPLVWLMSINIVIGALGSVQMALLTKRLDFRTLTRINATGILLSATVGITLAWAGYGVWALALQTTMISAVTTALLWAFSPWRPAFCFSIASLRSLFGFGGFLFASTLLHNLYANAYTVIIGRFFKVADLGFYQRATGLSDSASSLLSTIVARVSFPLFSTIADDPARLKRAARLSLQGSMFINAPAMTGLCLVAEPLIVTLYGETWRNAIPYLQILAIAGMFMPLHSINLSVLLAQGHSRQYFALEIAKKIVGIIGLIIGAYFGGVLGVAWATLVISVVGILINSYFTQRYIGYGLPAQLRDIAPTLAISFAMAGMVYGAGAMWAASQVLLLIVQLILGVSTFVLLAYVFRIEAFHILLNLLRPTKLVA